MRMAPAFLSRAATVSSSPGTWSAERGNPPHVERIPAVAWQSSRVIGTPWSAPRGPSPASALSASLARRLAPSSSRVTMALSLGLCRSMWARWASTTSDEETSLRRIAVANSCAGTKIVSSIVHTSPFERLLVPPRSLPFPPSGMMSSTRARCIQSRHTGESPRTPYVRTSEKAVTHELELLRIHLPRTSVNKGKRKGQGIGPWPFERIMSRPVLRTLRFRNGAHLLHRSEHVVLGPLLHHLAVLIEAVY